MMGACHEQREFERLLRECGAEFVAAAANQLAKTSIDVLIKFEELPSGRTKDEFAIASAGAAGQEGAPMRQATSRAAILL